MSFVYLMKRGEVFYFRRSVPQDLRKTLSRTEIWQSLRTRERHSAELIARSLTTKTDKLFFLARLSMTDKEIQMALRHYLDRFLSCFEKHRDTSSTLYEVAHDSPLNVWTWNEDILALEGAFPFNGQISEIGLSKLIEHYEAKVQYLSDCLRLRRFDSNALRLQTNILIEEHQLDVTPPERMVR